MDYLLSNINIIITIDTLYKYIYVYLYMYIYLYKIFKGLNMYKKNDIASNGTSVVFDCSFELIIWVSILNKYGKRTRMLELCFSKAKMDELTTSDIRSINNYTCTNYKNLISFIKREYHYELENVVKFKRGS